MSVFTIKVGDYTLLESGSIILMTDVSVHFSIRDLEFVFHFKEIKDSKPQINYKSNTGKTLEVEFINFNDPVGISNINPIEMGIIGDQKLYIMFRVSALKEGVKTMHYSWYTKSISSNNNVSNTDEKK
jgi:hypothetical protein